MNRPSDMNGDVWGRRILFLSLLLILFALPHTLEDFATGEPAKSGVPAPVLAAVISVVFAVQALGLFWMGQKHPRGIYVHVVAGIFWPLASGLAQLPVILSGEPYRAGVISVAYVIGMIVVGLLLLVSALMALRGHGENTRRGRHN